MTSLLNLLLIVGLIFPLVSFLTGFGCLVYRWRHRKFSPPVFIPLIGPVLLTAWIILARKPLWTVAIVWATDIGTLAVLASSPRLLRDWWRTCSFTRVLSLDGSKDNQTAVLSFHSTGHYQLRKSWVRPPGKYGLVGLGEPGTFIRRGDQYEMVSNLGVRRVLQRVDEGAFRVEMEELPNGELYNYSLIGWVLRA